MTLPDRIQQLVERFDRNFADYKQSRYNETQTRQEFINPFFKSLGWDMDNEQGLPEATKEVIHEANVKIGKATKSPDYCFRVGNNESSITKIGNNGHQGTVDSKFTAEP